MDMRFRAMSVLRTINTKAPKNRSNTKAAREIAVDCGLAAALFFAVSIFSFWNMDDMDGLLFLALALLSGAGLFLKKQLLRQGTVSALACTLFVLLTGCAAALGDNPVLPAVLALFLPVITGSICGIKNGLLLSGGYGVYILVLLYTPVLELVPARYPAGLQSLYPVLYGVVCVIFFVHSYSSHKQKISKHRNEESLEKAVKAEHDKLMAMTTQTILSISNAVDARDAYTKRHSSRVAEYSVLLAKALGWDSHRLEQLYSIALLHDIGKIGVSDSILNKRTALNDEEYETIKQHTVIGGEILKDLTLLPNASIGAVSHHEHFDGKGYPYGLKGTQIPLEARIIGIADAFDAMNSSRVYRAKMEPKVILRELENGRGRQFDPELLDKFLPIAEQILRSNEV